MKTALGCIGGFVLGAFMYTRACGKMIRQRDQALKKNLRTQRVFRI